MEARRDVALISIFGRLNWLAVELVQMGLDVTLIDLSEQFGHWAPEDWEGPFGLFQSELLPQSMMARLHEEDYFDTVDEGLTIWTKSGPLDVLGSNSNYLLEKRNISVEQQTYVQRFDSLSSKEIDKIKKTWRESRFQDTWFLQLAHSLASPSFYQNAEGLESVRPLPIFSSLALRRVSRKGYERALDYLESKKVKVIRKARLKDLSVVGRKLESLEVLSQQWSGVLAADQFIWSFSSAETAQIGKSFVSHLFSDQVIEPSWAWMRYRIEVSGTPLVNVLPKMFVVIEDRDLTWTHANLAIVQKTVNEAEFDFWVRIPTAHRFHRDYLEKIGLEIMSLFQRRVPGSQLRLVSWPQETHYDSSVLGPPRFAVYDREKLKKTRASTLSNLHFDGPERWELLDWTGQILHQKKIFDMLRNWKTERDQRLAKLEMQAAKREVRK